MQRIIRSTTHQGTGSEAVTCAIRMRQITPPNLAALFSISRGPKGEKPEWWSPLGGEPTPFAELMPEQQQQLLIVVEQCKTAFASLAKQLDDQGKTDDAQMIRKLLMQSNYSHSNLYSIDQQPVLIEWQWDDEPTATPVPASPSAVDDAAVAMAASAAPATAVKNRQRWPWILLLLLLLLALGLGAWWLLHNKNPGVAHDLTSSASPRGPIADYACSDKSGVSIPDFVTVFDTSGSMTLNIEASAEDEQWLLENETLYEHRNRDPKRLNMLKAPTREQVAKQAYNSMLAQIHPDISTRLLTFNGCENVVDHGLYNYQQRSSLIQTLEYTPSYAGTPLTASLRLAASQVDGVTKDAMIILFIDGEDGCGENICTLSAELAQTKPRLQINVMDVSGNGLSSCAAELTGGRLYSSQDVAEINNLFTQSAAPFNNQSCD